MRPINNKHFGVNNTRLGVKFYDGATVVAGYIVKQLGTHKFRVRKKDGTGEKDCVLAQTASELTALTAGTGADAAKRASLCTIEVTPFGGTTENVRHIQAFKVHTIQGSTLTWKLGVAAAAAGKGTMALVNVAPTVANAIPDQVGTVAAAFSYVIPANTFADVNQDTLVLSMGAVAGFAFDASTRTVSKAAAAGSVGAHNITITATDGDQSVSDTFTVTLS